ncbi:uncharacterized protein MCYG_03154 [Microsporum canis CBS 113480]|uniref:Uncharacterized protein n=1 Tax=Arthroderma otae (strain ATCC MYA-4605 / CBS 113480) TaxID=554155 RepID=C5FKW3_ARTOC|nr:uncharacterized protein MCYG_03154 [Microsporum canis CBS 113480]EEQ30335.1 predicted protein [Microsporum canis CBS 113480]
MFPSSSSSSSGCCYTAASAAYHCVYSVSPSSPSLKQKANARLAARRSAVVQKTTRNTGTAKKKGEPVEGCLVSFLPLNPHSIFPVRISLRRSTVSKRSPVVVHTETKLFATVNRSSGSSRIPSLGTAPTEVTYTLIQAYTTHISSFLASLAVLLDRWRETEGGGIAGTVYKGPSRLVALHRNV